MSEFILYLLEASAVLGILYSLYLLLLRKETFFNLNRFLLLAILVVSLVFPLISFDFSFETQAIDRPIEQISNARLSYYESLEQWTYSNEANGNTSTINKAVPSSISFFDVLMIIYGIGLVVMISRLIWTYLWISRLARQHARVKMGDVQVVKVPYRIAPFSFLNNVFVPDEMIGGEEFEQVLAHERTHIQQKHSIDLIFVQLLAAVLWFNPLVWLLIKSLKTTHEYIADKNMINQGYSLVEYQTLLLRQLISNNSYGLVHNFNLSFIKKRIAMMKIQSGWGGKLRAVLALSFTVAFSMFVVQCNSQIEDQVAASPQNTELNLPSIKNGTYSFKGGLDNAINLEIKDGEVSLNGSLISVDELGAKLMADFPEAFVVSMNVDQNQSMGLVRKVQWELRKIDKSKMLYHVQAEEGEKAIAFLLPPLPNSEMGKKMPVIDDAFAKKHDMDIYKIMLGDQDDQLTARVNEFVRHQMSLGKSNYVVSAKFDDDDTFGEYIVNLHAIKEAFNQIYEERAQSLFGKSFQELSDLRSESDEANERYRAVRENVPMAISVAESN